MHIGEVWCYRPGMLYEGPRQMVHPSGMHPFLNLLHFSLDRCTTAESYKCWSPFKSTLSLTSWHAIICTIPGGVFCRHATYLQHQTSCKCMSRKRYNLPLRASPKTRQTPASQPWNPCTPCHLQAKCCSAQIAASTIEHNLTQCHHKCFQPSQENDNS